MRRFPITVFILLLSTVLAKAQGPIFQEKSGFGLETQHYFEQADAAFDAGNMESAAELYAVAFEADQQNTKALYNLALANFNLTNYGKAEVALDKLLQLTPNDTAAFELLGHTLLNRGKAERAVECFDIVLQAKATDARYVNRALAKIAIRHTDEALNDLDMALQLNPQNFEACLGKGITLMELGQPTLASAWLQKALEVKPADATALTNLAVIKYRMGEKPAAMDDFRAALRSSRQSGTYLARAKCYLLDQNFSDAISDAREAMLLDGENAEVYAFIGEVELAKGDVKAAVESFGIAIDLKPDQAAHYMKRADANIQGKQFYEAVADLYRALDLDPYNLEAKAMLQVAYSHIDVDVQGGQTLSERND